MGEHIEDIEEKMSYRHIIFVLRIFYELAECVQNISIQKNTQRSCHKPAFTLYAMANKSFENCECCSNVTGDLVRVHFLLYYDK